MLLPEIPKHTQVSRAQPLIDAPDAGVSGLVPPPSPFPGLWCFAGDPWGSSTCVRITRSASPSRGVSHASMSKCPQFLFLKKSIFGYAGSSLLHGLSLVAVSWGYSLVASMGFALWGLLSVVAPQWSPGSRVCRLQELWLGCLEACGIFPNQESNPCPLHWQVDSRPLDH